MRDVFKYIVASHFFRKYAPEVKNYNNKLAGKNRHGNPLDFTEGDKKTIRAGLKQLFKDLKG
jgi:hypothetical protein